MYKCVHTLSHFTLHYTTPHCTTHTRCRHVPQDVRAVRLNGVGEFLLKEEVEQVSSSVLQVEEDEERPVYVYIYIYMYVCVCV
jgi:hypothetical protein